MRSQDFETPLVGERLAQVGEEPGKGMMRSWTREARLSLARIPGLARAPEKPAHIFRDLWPGDPGHGAKLLRGRFAVDFRDFPLDSHDWEGGTLPKTARQWLHGFSWLRDLRALGSDEARLRARDIVGSWIDHPPTDPLIADAATTGERLVSWMGHYEFFAGSADAVYRQRMMDRVLVEGRTIAALLPLPVNGWRGLLALKGLLAAAISIPSQSGFFSRSMRYLERELERLILPDGCLADRSPEAQFQAVRVLVEMGAMLRAAQIPVPSFLSRALARICPVLRAMRHGDGGLALFNGASEHGKALVDAVLNLGTPQRVVAPAMPDGGFYRLVSGKGLLLIDAGMPPPHGFDAMAGGGTLSFEFSYGLNRIFVNCGSAQSGPWEHALKATAAHTALTLDDRSCVDFAPGGGLVRRPARVTATHQSQDGSHWVDMSHDGYRASLGAHWQRRLYLGDDGHDLRGEETIDCERRLPVALRFHIHPGVAAHMAEDGREVVLEVGGQVWRFRQDGGAMSLEESVYVGEGKVVQTAQIVLTLDREPEVPALPDEPEEPLLEDVPPDASAAADSADSPEQVEAPLNPAASDERIPPAVDRPLHKVIQWALELAPE